MTRAECAKIALAQIKSMYPGVKGEKDIPPWAKFCMPEESLPAIAANNFTPQANSRRELAEPSKPPRPANPQQTLTTAPVAEQKLDQVATDVASMKGQMSELKQIVATSPSIAPQQAETAPVFAHHYIPLWAWVLGGGIVLLILITIVANVLHSQKLDQNRKIYGDAFKNAPTPTIVVPPVKDVKTTEDFRNHLLSGLAGLDAAHTERVRGLEKDLEDERAAHGVTREEKQALEAKASKIPEFEARVSELEAAIAASEATVAQARLDVEAANQNAEATAEAKAELASKLEAAEADLSEKNRLLTDARKSLKAAVTHHERVGSQINKALESTS
jgi:hypothetical protein